MARRKKMNKKRQDMMVELLRNGHTIGYACELLGVSRATEYKFRVANPEYRARVDEALDVRCEIVEEALYAKAAAGDVRAAEFWLINRSAGRWQARRNLEVTGADGGPIEVKDASGLSEEERIARIVALLDRARERRAGQASEGDE